TSVGAVVAAQAVDRRCVPAFYGGGVLLSERDVRLRRHAVATWLRSDRVQREVVARSPPEQDVGIGFELTLAHHDEPELAERGFVHPPARCKVAHSDPDVIDHLTHSSALCCGNSKRAMTPSSPPSGTGRSGWRVPTHPTPRSGYMSTSGNRLLETPSIRAASADAFENVCRPSGPSGK